MFSEILLFFVTICLLVYFNDNLPISIQSRVDKGKLYVVENAMYAMLHVVKKVKIVKSDYVWENRSKYSTIMRNVLDYVMGVTHIVLIWTYLLEKILFQLSMRMLYTMEPSMILLTCLSSYGPVGMVSR